ncbi:MAG: rod shape-determining protein MreC [Clostridia bacterium]|nr:rod shape-determining protein MreC [Clostridia bacterium]
MYKDKKSGILGIFVTVVILIILVLLTNTENNNLTAFENAASRLATPIQNGLTYLKNKVNGNNSFFTDINNLQTENEELKKKNSELEQELRKLETIKTENQSLKEYLSLTEKYADYKTLPADVINRDISNYSKTIVINVGTKNEVKEGMTVVGDKGLVGYIISATDNTAKVQTIVDTASSVSSLMSTSRDPIVCKGTLDGSSTLKAMYIPTEAQIIQGDSIETSGIGGIYPKGIHIGNVQRVVNTNNSIDRYAIIETAVNFQKLESVLVVTNH